MHEMSLMESVREIVIDAARAHGARRVAAVRVRIGAFASVDPDALRFAFDVVMRGSCAESARFEIETVPGAGWCWDCARSVTVAAGDACCPECHGQRLEITAGTEMRVHEIDLAADEETATCA